jgi:hypothetical protein
VIRVLSLGAGVQSTTVALLAAAGELPPLDCAIFADTGAEPRGVYDHLARLVPALPFPVHIISAGNLYLEILKATRRESKRGSHARPPLFVKNPDGSRGMIRRQCTGDYKIDPIERKVRELLGLVARQRWPREVRAIQVMGISIDEASRMRASRIPTIAHEYPLIDLGWTRSKCLAWLAARGWHPPKSACTFCPYHDDATWRRLRDTDAAGWAQAVEVDRAIRHGLKGDTLSGELFVHSSLIPLELVDLSTPAERGQPNLFENDCEGHCGV